MIRRGKGRIFIAADRIEPAPTPLLEMLADEILPFKITGEIEFMINRTDDAWILTLLNNKGFSKEPRDMPVIDFDGSADVTVEFRFEVEKIEDIYCHCGVKIPENEKSLSLRLHPGEFRIFKFFETQRNDQ
jgi:hypothetical protein